MDTPMQLPIPNYGLLSDIGKQKKKKRRSIESRGNLIVKACDAAPKASLILSLVG